MKKHEIFPLAISFLLFFSCNNGDSTNQSNDSTAANTQDTVSGVTVKETAFPERVFWGDEHLHTAWSGDAGSSGTIIEPEDALRFAMGEEIKNNTGNLVKLARPLDWLAITDHSDGLGAIIGTIKGDPEFMKDSTVKSWHELIVSGDKAKAYQATLAIMKAQGEGTIPRVLISPKSQQVWWEKSNAIMDKYYKPGTFTPFIGYEWTSNYMGGNNMHRNVIYRDNAALANQLTPLTTFTTTDPEDLWKWMQQYEDKTGGQIMAIPHNGNLSNGYMFAHTTLAGKPMTKEYAETRSKWEFLYEITQSKGTSEAHPSLSPSDEFANFEIWDKGNLKYQQPKKPGDIKTEYLREALKDGLAFEQKLGVNPFKLGIAAGVDSHTGLATTGEDNFEGKFANTEERPERWKAEIAKYKGGVQKGWELGATGFTAVWATANTREVLYDAMKRRETYATTGPRMTVRVFAGYDFTNDDLNAADMAARGYKKGVPMGGDLSASAAGKKPSLLITAIKDPMGANLDRVQVIKGWIDSKGNKQEKIFEVVWGDADKRKPDAKGKLPAVGNSINMETLEVSNNIGDPELKTLWTDPEFDASLPCFYYVRVLEIPTPRWTAYDRKKFNAKMDANVTMTQQERAYTSPIWFTPAK
jgi:hypothetical protein